MPNRVTLGFPPQIYRFIEQERYLTGETFSTTVMRLLRETAAWKEHIRQIEKEGYR